MSSNIIIFVSQSLTQNKQWDFTKRSFEILDAGFSDLFRAAVGHDFHELDVELIINFALITELRGYLNPIQYQVGPLLM